MIATGTRFESSPTQVLINVTTTSVLCIRRFDTFDITLFLCTCSFRENSPTWRSRWRNEIERVLHVRGRSAPDRRETSRRREGEREGQAIVGALDGLKRVARCSQTSRPFLTRLLKISVRTRSLAASTKASQSGRRCGYCRRGRSQMRHRVDGNPAEESTGMSKRAVKIVALSHLTVPAYV